MCTIVTCHILQARSNDWNHMRNVGARVFFLLGSFSLMALHPELKWSWHWL